MDDSGDQIMSGAADVSPEAPAPDMASVPAPATVQPAVAAQSVPPAQTPVQPPAPGHGERREGWFRRGARSGAIAALVVIVAGAFFTIGWFTSTRGDDRGRPGGAHMLMNKHGRGWGDMRGPGGQYFQMPSPRGLDNQGYNAPRGSFGYGRGMMVPQQGQGMVVPQQGPGMMVPQQGQSGVQQSSPPVQVVPLGQ